MKVSVIIPTMNEEKGIAEVIKKIPKDYELIVIDKSTDKTAEMAKKAGAKVIIQKTEGKGNAMIEAAKAAKGDIIVFIDGDGTYPADKIKELVKEIQYRQGDIVVGSRRLIKNKNITPLNLFGNNFFCAICSFFYEPTTDILTGMQAIRKTDLLNFDLKSSGFEIETEIFIKAHKNKLKRIEIPIEYKRRLGQSNLHPFKDGLRILVTILKGLFY